MSVFSNAQKLLLLAILTALMAGALMYEVLHPTLFPLLKQGICSCSTTFRSLPSRAT